MKLATCLFICCAIGISHTKSSDVRYYGTEERFDALFVRIDQLEARDRLHQTEINNLRHDHETKIEKLRNDHETEIDKLRHDHQADLDLLRHDLSEQTVRINDLEITVRRQDDTIKELMNARDAAAKPKQQDVAKQRNSTLERKERSAYARNRIRQVENDIEVAFFATLSTKVPHLGSNQAVAFDHVVTNTGNSYNPHVGVFIAPVTGTYVFAVTLTTNNRDRAEYGIFRNLEQITIIFVNGADNSYDTSSQTAILHLTKGDDVTIKHLGFDHSLYVSSYCMFSGFLLSQDFTDSSPVVVGK